MPSTDPVIIIHTPDGITTNSIEVSIRFGHQGKMVHLEESAGDGGLVIVDGADDSNKRLKISVVPSTRITPSLLEALYNGLKATASAGGYTQIKRHTPGEINHAPSEEGPSRPSARNQEQGPQGG